MTMDEKNFKSWMDDIVADGGVTVADVVWKMTPDQAARAGWDAAISHIAAMRIAGEGREAVGIDGMKRAALNRAIEALTTVGLAMGEHKARQCQRDIDEIRVLLATPPEPSQRVERAGEVPEKITVSMAPTSQYAKGWNDCVDTIATPAPVAAPAALTDDALIDAANARADLYEGDDRPCIKTDVMNAFYAGAEFAKRALLAASPAGQDARDAARYRWLRAINGETFVSFIGSPGWKPCGATLDAAIDAAMTATPPSGT